MIFYLFGYSGRIDSLSAQFDRAEEKINKYIPLYHELIETTSWDQLYKERRACFKDCMKLAAKIQEYVDSGLLQHLEVMKGALQDYKKDYYPLEDEIESEAQALLEDIYACYAHILTLQSKIK